MGELRRAYRIWERLNCDLVEDEETHQWAYQLRTNSTTAPPDLPADVNDVAISYDETQAALKAKQEQVYGLLQSAHYLAAQQARAQADAQQGPPTVRAEHLYDWGLNMGKHLGQQRRPPFQFALDADNYLLFELLCYYFARDERFVRVGKEQLDLDLSLDKGIALFGGVGRGKTVLMEVFRSNPLRPYGLVSARKVSQVFLEDAIGDGKRPSVSHAQQLYLGQGQRFLCFDDVARESAKVQYMGNPVHPMQAVILERADRFRLGHLPGWATHLTSNNPLVRQEGQPADMPSLTELYGAPAVDRLYELCNIFELGGESRRG